MQHGASPVSGTTGPSDASSSPSTFDSTCWTYEVTERDIRRCHCPSCCPSVLPTPMQLFMFSAVTWNRHHIHYSADEAPEVGAGALLRLRYQGWLTAEGEREVASAEEVLCIQWPT